MSYLKPCVRISDIQLQHRRVKETENRIFNFGCVHIMLFSFILVQKVHLQCVCVGCKGISFKSFKIVFAFLLKRSLLYQQIKLVLCIGTRSRMYKAKLALTLKAPKKKKKKNCI